ncbi:hypothetical protein DFH06DRAFT_61647 [Mycena polygramma]|nr:hypothetical protein DFH06DRAFT_61647 [Mycena polygramma]
MENRAAPFSASSMSSPNHKHQKGNCFLRHEADMWELDSLAEQELRAQQIREDFGLEDDIGKLVDQPPTNSGCLNFRGELVPEKILLTSYGDHECSILARSPESLGIDRVQVTELPGCDLLGSKNSEIGALARGGESSQSCHSFDEDQPPLRRPTARNAYLSDFIPRTAKNVIYLTYIVHWSRKQSATSIPPWHQSAP